MPKNNVIIQGTRSQRISLNVINIKNEPTNSVVRIEDLGAELCICTLTLIEMFIFKKFLLFALGTFSA